MSFSTNVLPLSLESYFQQHPITADLPISFALTNEKLSLISDSKVSKTVDENTVELVVFEHMALSQLLNLQTQTNVEITALSTINKRNQQVSYRFTVNCTDFIKARKTLADFALEQGFEVVGATGIEDKLQERVRETYQDFNRKRLYNLWFRRQFL